MDVKKLLLINLAIAFFLILCILSDRWNLIQKPHYTASDFSILEHISSTDCDQDGIDDAHDLVEGYNIRAVPTLIFIKNNYIVGRTSGALSSDVLINKINELK